MLIAAVVLSGAGGWFGWRHYCETGQDVQPPAVPPEYDFGAGARLRGDATAVDSYPKLKSEPDGSPSQGPAPCLDCRDLADGAEAWTVTADGMSPAHASITGLGSGKSNTARFTMGGEHFSLDSKPTGVLVQIKWSGAPNTEAVVRLTCNGSPLGSDKAANSVLPEAPAFTSYGASGDRWGAAITQTMANDPSFGVDIVVDQVLYGAATNIAEVHITVYEGDAKSIAAADGSELRDPPTDESLTKAILDGQKTDTE
jgi:hypothetical protein